MKVHEQAGVAVVGASNKKFQSFKEEIYKIKNSDQKKIAVLSISIKDTLFDKPSGKCLPVVIQLNKVQTI